MNIRKTLCTLSGDDYSIISKCPKTLQNRFASIGLFVACISLLCFVSSYFTFTMLFQNYFIGIPISIFFAWMITNIYLLLLYTLSKNVLPHIISQKAKLVAVGIRIIFVCFIAVIISKPIEALIFSSALSNEIENYKQEQIEKYTVITENYFNNETAQIIHIIEKQEKLYGNSNIENIEQYKTLLGKKSVQKEKLISKMTNLVQNSNYYIQSIIILNSKYRVCWLFTIFIVFIFLCPAYLKYFLSEQSNFNQFRKEFEMQLVQKEYASFKSKFGSMLKEKYRKDISFCELYIDPPFNTIRKKDERAFLKEDDLIAELYNA